VSAAAAHDPDPSDALAWYVYAVLPAEHAASPAEGVMPGSRVEALPMGRLTVLAGRVPRGLFDSADPGNRTGDPDWMAERLAAHHGVVGAAGPCLPMAFGTLFSGLSLLRGWLAPRVDVLLAALRQAGRQTEWALTVQEDATALAGWTDAIDPAVNELSRAMAGAGQGTAFLMARRLDKARAAARQRHLAAVPAIVEACAEDAGLGLLPERARDGLPAWTALLPNDRPDALRALLRDLSQRLPPGLSPRHTGPWPAYAYARAALGAELVDA
jgi:hypothetical protein